MQRAARLVAGVVALVLAAGGADGEEPRPTTGRTARLRLPSVGAVALDARFTHGGPYTRALQAVRDSRYRSAAELFRDAAAEARQAASDGRLPSRVGRLLYAKAARQEGRCELLALEERREGAGRDLLRQAIALHNLLLAARAHQGRPEPLLARRTALAYQAALQLERMPARLLQAQLGYAQLLALEGRRGEARATVARVPLGELASLGSAEEAAAIYLEVAAVWAALGDGERAISCIAAARDLSPDWSESRASALLLDNDFDTLREDPRFAKLARAPDEDVWPDDDG